MLKTLSKFNLHREAITMKAKFKKKVNQKKPIQ
jgi:hypothetical protein